MIVYGVYVCNCDDNDPVGRVEAVFANEPDACTYAHERSTERDGNRASVCRWRLDAPGTREDVCLSVDGEERDRRSRSRTV